MDAAARHLAGPVAGLTNVNFPDGAWTADISHGELIRDGYDQSMVVDACRPMQLLYQGRDPASDGLEYSQLPYGLGLLTQVPRQFEASQVPGPRPPIPRGSLEPINLGPDAQGNFVANGTFEASTEGWLTYAGTLSLSSDRAHGGQSSAVLTGRTETWQGPVHDLFGRVEAGAAYQVTAWASIGGPAGTEAAPAADAGAPPDGGPSVEGDATAADIAAPQPVSLTFHSNCAGADTYTNIAPGMANPSAWTELRGTLVVPTCVLGAIDIYVEGPAVGVDLYVDDVSVFAFE